jgi:chemotaxis protein CheZ
MVFEACNFQDLTGQRITKVVNTLRFVEERIIKMMEIWGGADKFKDIEVELEHRMGDQGLLNGPSLGTDQDIASQDDIDALFN